MRDTVLDHITPLTSLKGQAWAVVRNRLTQVAESMSLLDDVQIGGKRLADQSRPTTPLAGVTARKVAGMAAYQSGGVAVLPMSGVILPRPNVLTHYGLATAASQFADAHAELLADSSVTSIVWDVDSPGGSVAGVPEAADKLLSLRGKKRTVAVSNTLMASAAYWLASAADEIVATPSSLTGSIGVVVVHDDFSGANARAGISVTYIAAGKYKTDGNSDQPLSPSALASMQATVNDFYGLFVGSVARGRKTSREAVKAGYGEGDAVTAQRAVAARLADRVGTLEAVVGSLGRGAGSGRAVSAAMREARQRQAVATLT